MNPNINLAGIGFLGGSNRVETIKYFKLNYFRFGCKAKIEAHLKLSSIKNEEKEGRTQASSSVGSHSSSS